MTVGGNAGIGRETVKVSYHFSPGLHGPIESVVRCQVLLNRNAKVYMASRDEKKARIAIEELKAQTGKEAIYLELNLANLASVRKSAEEFLRCAAA